MDAPHHPSISQSKAIGAQDGEIVLEGNDDESITKLSSIGLDESVFCEDLHAMPFISWLASS
jgi:hypothetical protein